MLRSLGFLLVFPILAVWAHFSDLIERPRLRIRTSIFLGILTFITSLILLQKGLSLPVQLGFISITWLGSCFMSLAIIAVYENEMWFDQDGAALMTLILSLIACFFIGIGWFYFSNPDPSSVDAFLTGAAWTLLYFGTGVISIPLRKLLKII